ncbi:MAG: hypothetical protein ACRELV_01725 [Longimicrobiales bacterium]
MTGNEQMTKLFRVRAVCFFLVAFLSAFGARGTAGQETPGAARIDQIDVEPGSGSFAVQGGQGHEEKTITVFYHQPESFHPVGVRSAESCPAAG